MENKYVDFSQESIARIQKDIRDKDKNNGFTRLITVFQVGWFVLQYLGRVAQGIAVTMHTTDFWVLEEETCRHADSRHFPHPQYLHRQDPS